MPCSRMPKCTLRAPQLPAATSPPFLNTTLVEAAERLEAGPTQLLLGEPHLLFAERGAVGLWGVLLVGTAEGDVGAHDHERRPVGDAPRRGERGVERAEVIAVRHTLHVPAVALEPFGDIVRVGQIGFAVDRDAIA